MTPILVTMLTQLVGLSLVLVASALLLAEHNAIFARFIASRAAKVCRVESSPPDGFPQCTLADHQSPSAEHPPAPLTAAPIIQAAVELPEFTAPEVHDSRRAPYRTLGGSC